VLEAIETEADQAGMSSVSEVLNRLRQVVVAMDFTT
jgi:hypothetical protein